MATRANHRSVLKRARAVLLLALAFASAGIQPARAHNSWTGGYRKFPWKASADRTITTLPGQCPHCPGSESSSAWKAIDVGDMDYETVYSIAPGVVDAVNLSGSSAAGIYVRIKDNDGTYITYEHLKSVIVADGAGIVVGQPIAVSGNTGNSSGPHLHFQRQSGTSFSSTALSLVPISSHGESGDPLSRTAYTSDNAGIGYSSGGTGSTPMRAAYSKLGGYNSVGVTANIGDAFSPCRDDAIKGTWWRYRCEVGPYGGSVQTYFDQGRERALTVADGSSTAFSMARGILAAYTDEWYGHDWVYYIGYPTGNRYVWTSGVYRQDFENGFVTMEPSSCTEWIYQAGRLKTSTPYCD